jgi:hypothetical protein
MATPPYIGNGQPQAAKSAWSGLTSWFGGTAPAYKPAPTAPSSTSASKATTSTASASAPTDTDDATTSSSAQPTRVIIIVPHGGFIPGVEWPDSQQ